MARTESTTTQKARVFLLSPARLDGVRASVHGRRPPKLVPRRPARP